MFMLFSTFVLVGSNYAAPPPDNNWIIVWSDEFNDTEVDMNKWSYLYPGIMVREAYSTTEDAYLENGNLVIRSRKDGDLFKTSILLSRRKFEHRYGYYEIKADVSGLEAFGQWVAFWLCVDKPYDHDGNTDTGIEIDIMEYPIHTGNDIFHYLHWDHKPDGGHVSQGRQIAVPNLRDGFHLFALEWTPSEYIFYVDNQETWRTSTAISHAEQFIYLSLEIQANWWDTNYAIEDYSHLLPDYWIIDYIRVYDLRKLTLPKRLRVK
jgi:beta-glucanase (GH16 family)